MKYMETVIECSYDECGKTIRVKNETASTEGEVDPIKAVMNQEGWKSLRWMALGRGRASEREYCVEHWDLVYPAIPHELRDNSAAPEVSAD